MVCLKITVERIDGHCDLPMEVGDCMYVDGSKLIIPQGKHMCLWALQSMMPVFPAMQRPKGHEEDWIGESNLFVCPDPKGLVHFRIERMQETAMER